MTAYLAQDSAIQEALESFATQLQQGVRLLPSTTVAQMDTLFPKGWDNILLQDLCEGALVKAALATQISLERLAGQIFSHKFKTGRKKTWQQFSTPPAIGESMVELAQLHPEHKILEPSAGNGLLALQLRRAGGPCLYLNELEETRSSILRLVFPDTPVARLNAEYLGVLKKDWPRMDRIVMNPPFSNSAPSGYRRQRRVTSLHLEGVVPLLAPGGRLVCLTSHAFQPDQDRQLMDTLGRFQVAYLDRYPIPGRLYQRFGTTFPTAIHVFVRNAKETPK